MTNVADDDAARLAALIGDSDSADECDADESAGTARLRVERPSNAKATAPPGAASSDAGASLAAAGAGVGGMSASAAGAASAASSADEAHAPGSFLFGELCRVRDRAHWSAVEAQVLERKLAMAEDLRSVDVPRARAASSRALAEALAALRRRAARRGDGAGDGAAARDDATTWDRRAEGWAYERNERLARLEQACDEARRAFRGVPYRNGDGVARRVVAAVEACLEHRAANGEDDCYAAFLLEVARGVLRGPFASPRWRGRVARDGNKATNAGRGRDRRRRGARQGDDAALPRRSRDAGRRARLGRAPRSLAPPHRLGPGPPRADRIAQRRRALVEPRGARRRGGAATEAGRARGCALRRRGAARRPPVRQARVRGAGGARGRRRRVPAPARARVPRAVSRGRRAGLARHDAGRRRRRRRLGGVGTFARRLSGRGIGPLGAHAARRAVVPWCRRGVEGAFAVGVGRSVPLPHQHAVTELRRWRRGRVPLPSTPWTGLHSPVGGNAGTDVPEEPWPSPGGLAALLRAGARSAGTLALDGTRRGVSTSTFEAIQTPSTRRCDGVDGGDTPHRAGEGTPWRRCDVEAQKLGQWFGRRASRRRPGPAPRRRGRARRGLAVAVAVAAFGLGAGGVRGRRTGRARGLDRAGPHRGR